MFCGSSSRYRGVDYNLLLWYFLIILTYFFLSNTVCILCNEFSLDTNGIPAMFVPWNSQSSLQQDAQDKSPYTTLGQLPYQLHFVPLFMAFSLLLPMKIPTMLACYHILLNGLVKILASYFVTCKMSQCM